MTYFNTYILKYFVTFVVLVAVAMNTVVVYKVTQFIFKHNWLPCRWK